MNLSWLLNTTFFRFLILLKLEEYFVQALICVLDFLIVFLTAMRLFHVRINTLRYLLWIRIKGISIQHKNIKKTQKK